MRFFSILLLASVGCSAPFSSQAITLDGGESDGHDDAESDIDSGTGNPGRDSAVPGQTDSGLTTQIDSGSASDGGLLDAGDGGGSGDSSSADAGDRDADQDAGQDAAPKTDACAPFAWSSPDGKVTGTQPQTVLGQWSFDGVYQAFIVPHPCSADVCSLTAACISASSICGLAGGSQGIQSVASAKGERVTLVVCNGAKP